MNWKEALGEAQAQVEKVMKPKLDALHSAVSELEAPLKRLLPEKALFLIRLGVAGHRDRRLFTFQAPVSRAAVSAQEPGRIKSVTG